MSFHDMKYFDEKAAEQILNENALNWYFGKRKTVFHPS